MVQYIRKKYKGSDFVNGLTICGNLHKEILQRNPIGRIYSVFDSSFNILYSNCRLITVINNRKTMLPNSIKIYSNRSFLNTVIRSDQRVCLFPEYASIGDRNTKIMYGRAKLWDKNPDLSFKRDSKKAVLIKLNVMRQILAIKGDSRGIFPLVGTLQGRIEGLDSSLWCGIALNEKEKFIENRFVKFIEDYARENICDLPADVKKIIGYGVGLTPAMDDFLSGMMISRIYLSNYLDLDMEQSYRLNQSMLEEVDGRTTLISQNMLKYSSRGQCAEDIRNLMVNILGGGTLDGFISGIGDVIAMGASSGTDLLLGIYVGSIILLNRNRGIE